MYVRAGRPAFARPCVGIHKSTSLMSSSLLFQQCPACLVRLTWIVFVIEGRWPYSWCLVGCCCEDCLVSYLGHSLWKSYPSAEMKSVYFTAAANWTGLYLILNSFLFTLLTLLLCIPAFFICIFFRFFIWSLNISLKSLSLERESLSLSCRDILTHLNSPKVSVPYILDYITPSRRQVINVYIIKLF